MSRPHCNNCTLHLFTGNTCITKRRQARPGIPCCLHCMVGPPLTFAQWESDLMRAANLVRHTASSHTAGKVTQDKVTHPTCTHKRVAHQGLLQTPGVAGRWPQQQMSSHLTFESSKHQTAIPTTSISSVPDWLQYQHDQQHICQRKHHQHLCSACTPRQSLVVLIHLLVSS